ncbi:hypothetical protein LX77_02803 [Gelidibacter algens]|uniref:Uncharacterized protein n=1 Tax=Gelidibacter algens TaxID=49280 RepID=A0A327RVT7_9FLAO|nr:hypothetical protein LX77_02803 [Gelidibacter algens]
MLICAPTSMPNRDTPQNQTIRAGAEQIHLYFPLLQNKRVAISANQTSIIGES